VNLEEVRNFLKGHFRTDGAARAIVTLTFQSRPEKKIFYRVYIGVGQQSNGSQAGFEIFMNGPGFINTQESAFFRT